MKGRTVKSGSKRKPGAQSPRKDERLFRTLIEHSTDAIALVSSEGAIFYASPAATRVLGYSVDELVGRNAPVDLHPDDLVEVRRLLSELAQKPNLCERAEYGFDDPRSQWPGPLEAD